MNKDFETAFVLLKDALCRAVIKDHEEIFVWRNYLQDIPFCEVADVSGEEILTSQVPKSYQAPHTWTIMPIFNPDKLGLSFVKIFTVLFLALAIVIIVLLAF